MAGKILFVDDDSNILSGFQRTLRGRYSVATADSGDKALGLLDQDSFAVIVSDFRMPAMNGVEFLSKASAKWPDSVRVLLTGEADTRAAAGAVNQGQIFRFLTKPCPAATLEKTLSEALKQHDLITAEKVLLEKTLRGSMAVLSEILNLLQPLAFSRAGRISRIAEKVLAAMNITNKWEFEIAAMLSHIGCITVPMDIVNKVCQGTALTDKELAAYRSHPIAGCRLIEKVPRLELVAQIIASQAYPSPTLPPWHEIEQADRLTFGAHLLKLAADVEHCVSLDMLKPALIHDLKTKNHHPSLIKAAEAVLPEIGFSLSPAKPVSTMDLETGMILDADIIGDNGLLLVAKGQLLSETLIQFLQRRLQFSDHREIVQVRTNH